MVFSTKFISGAMSQKFGSFLNGRQGLKTNSLSDPFGGQPSVSGENPKKTVYQYPLDLGGSPEPEKIVYATYSTCSGMHDYCGTMGCSVEVFDHEGNKELGYIHPADWYIRPVNVLSQIPTFELVMPLSNGKLRIVKVIDGELTATVVDK